MFLKLIRKTNKIHYIRLNVKDLNGKKFWEIVQLHFSEKVYKKVMLVEHNVFISSYIQLAKTLNN